MPPEPSGLPRLIPSVLSAASTASLIFKVCKPYFLTTVAVQGRVPRLRVISYVPVSAHLKLGPLKGHRLSNCESTDENSRYFYPRLLKAFMANDTLMTPEEFQYFYYGTMFQEIYHRKGTLRGYSRA